MKHAKRDQILWNPGVSIMPSVKIMSFNLKHNVFSFGKNAWKNREKRAAMLIRRLAPDIIGTQELTHQALEDLCGRLPEYAWCGQARGGDERGEYAAILYRKARFQLDDTNTFWLSDTPDVPSRDWFALFPRICTCCQLTERESGKSLRIYNTHLDHLSARARINGVKLIMERLMEEDSAIPVVFMGDFNAKPGSRTLRTLESLLDAGLPGPQKDRGENSPTEKALLTDSYSALLKRERPIGRSYHGFSGKTRGAPIDYIFTSRAITIKRVRLDRSTTGQLYPSDHYPVIADLEY